MRTQRYNSVGSLELNSNNNSAGQPLTQAPQSTSCPRYSFLSQLVQAKQILLDHSCQDHQNWKLPRAPLNGSDIHKQTGRVRACSGAVWSTAEPELVPCHDGNLTLFIKPTQLKLMSQITSRVPWSTAPSFLFHGERSTWATPPLEAGKSSLGRDADAQHWAGRCL